MFLDPSYVLFFLFLSFITGVEEQQSEVNWIRHFNNYIKTNAGVHQIVTFVDENDREDHQGRSKMLWKAIRTFPVRTIDFQEATIDNARQLIQTPSFLNIQTSLFITIQSQVDNQSQTRLGKVQDFVIELSQTRQRPKYLMIFFREEEETQTYESLLRELWTKQFLDATVLEILKPRVGRQDFFLDHHQEMARVIYYNPFTETITRRFISRDVGLFPDKLIDMHGYEMKIPFLNRPPEASLNYNQSNQNLSGLMFQKVKALSQAMKFSIKIPVNITWYGKVTCSKNGSTELLHSLKNNLIRFSGMEFGRFGECDQLLYEWCKGIGNNDICLVVPILEEGSNRLTTTWKVMNVIVVLSMPLILWVISRILRFDKRNWRLEYMVEIVFGFSVPRSPEKDAERLFLAATLCAYFLYSSVIYTALTSITVSQDNITRFQNIEEVVNSELEILITPLHYSLLHNTDEGVIKDLLDKATKIDMSYNECIHRLLKDRNVGCILKKVKARWILRNQKDDCGRPVAKIMREYVAKTYSITVFEPGSPFVKKIEDLIQRLYQAGSVIKWLKDYNIIKSSKKGETSISCTNHQAELSVIMRHLFVLVGFGYACSIILFLIELVTHFLKKKLRHVLHVN